MGEQIFLPVKTLNELRREAIALLEQELCAPYRRSATDTPVMATADKPADTNYSLSILVSCETVDQALLLYKNNA